ncbi:MAG: hypothetical protein ABEI74_04845 [Candidatus Pacearchaeota archaeon]
MALKDWKKIKGQRTWANSKTGELIYITKSTPHEMMLRKEKYPFETTVLRSNRTTEKTLVKGVRLKTALSRARGYMKKH